MKTCPTCHRNYENEAKFCFDDGSLLVAETASGMTTASGIDPTLHLPGHSTEQPPNVLYPQQTSPQQSTVTSGGMKPPASTAPVSSNTPYASKARSRAALLWVVAALIIGVAAIAVALIVTRGFRRDENAATEPATATASPSEAMTSSESSTTSSEGKPASLSETTPSNQPTNKKEQEIPTLKGAPTEKSLSAPTPVEKATPHAPISGGVLNGKAIYLAKPAYPPSARAAHASGSVTVQVLIDENGKVLTAHAVSGHPLLQASAISAARASKFTPTKLSGQQVKVSGVIVYNFVAQ
jgi:TonB family protein